MQAPFYQLSIASQVVIWSFESSLKNERFQPALKMLGQTHQCSSVINVPVRFTERY